MGYSNQPLMVILSTWSFFGNYFYTIQLFGILWELFEYYLHYDKTLVKWLGGCLDNKPGPSSENYQYRHNLVTKGINKKYNPIDTFFGIKNSTQHGWHHSIAEIIGNVIAFIVGQQFIIKSQAHMSHQYPYPAAQY